MISRQTRIDGTADTPPPGAALTRNADGSLPDLHRKAIQWYMVTNGYKPFAMNTWPTYEFSDRDGNRVKIHLSDAIKQYEEWKKDNHGKRKVAA